MNAYPATVRILIFAVAVLGVVPSTAQEYGVYLNCSGHVEAGSRTKNANLDLALQRIAGRRQDEARDHTCVLFDGFRAPARNSAVCYD